MPPVRLGAQCGHAEVAKHLIADKADVNTCIKSGASALYTACFRVSAALVKFGEGMLAAEYAARAQGHVDVIELLLQNGANVNKAKKAGATPLFAAAQQYAPNADPGICQTVWSLTRSGVVPGTSPR